MLNCKPAVTPVDTEAKLSATDGSPASDAPLYRSIVDAHWTAIKRILRYIRGTLDFGLSLQASTSLDLIAYYDADWAGCPDTRHSTSGYCVYIGPSLISWSSKRQLDVSRSSAKAEYRAIANVVVECSWLCHLLHELLSPVDKAMIVYCDNVSVVYLSANPVHHRRAKHIEISIVFGSR